jgi:hypothetical protein
MKAFVTGTMPLSKHVMMRFAAFKRLKRRMIRKILMILRRVSVFYLSESVSLDVRIARGRGDV